MKRTILAILGGLTMLGVLLFSAALTLRVVLHAREVPIPDLAGMTVSEASTAALHSGLDLNIENQFYSTTVPAGRILSQAPAAGSRVRKGWQVRVIESLGPQQVTIPDVVGEPVRQATMDLRRTSLDLGTLGHLDAPGDPDMVLAQTPPPNAGVDQPRVNLLLSATAEGASSAFVMPSFVGMSYGPANRAAIALGLRVAIIGGPAAPPPAAPTPVALPPGAHPGPNGTIVGPNGELIALPPTPLSIPAPPPTPGGPVNSQSPPAGYRANKGGVVRLIFNAPAAPAEPANTTPATTSGAQPASNQPKPASPAGKSPPQ